MFVLLKNCWVDYLGGLLPRPGPEGFGVFDGAFGGADLPWLLIVFSSVSVVG